MKLSCIALVVIMAAGIVLLLHLRWQAASFVCYRCKGGWLERIGFIRCYRAPE